MRSISIGSLIIMVLLLNPSAFFADNHYLPHLEEASDKKQLEKEVALNDISFSSLSPQLSVTTSSSTGSSPFFSPHQYTGVDSDFSNDKAFFLTKEGTFFPKATYSKIAFYAQYADFIKARILAVNDITGRYLRVYQGSDPTNLVLETQMIIRPNQENFVNINFNAPATNLYVVFEIYLGNYAEKGWMLEWAYFKNDTSQNYRQFFPKRYISEIETQFIGGSDTKLDLQISRFQDSRERFVSIYVDDNLVLDEQSTTNGWFTLSNFNLGDFEEREVHNLTIRIRSGNLAEFGWQLTQLDIGYTALHVEVDWMEGYEPPMEIFDTIGSYFEDNGYERLQFHTNSAPIPVDEITTIADLIDYYDRYSWTRVLYPENHRYLLFGKYAQNDGLLGFNPFANLTTEILFQPYAFIAVQEIKDLDDNLIWRFFTDLNENIMAIAMHELGHTLGLVKKICDGSSCPEYYGWGNRDISVMNALGYDNSRSSPLYSQFWWNGDGRWWDLRVVRSLNDSAVIKPISEVVV